MKKHISYLAADEVAEICKPLFESFNIGYFDYAKIYQDNSSLVLTSNREWHDHFFKKKYVVSGTNVTSGVHLWENYLPEGQVREHVVYANHYNGITVFTKNKDAIEFFDLASSVADRSIIDFYFNNLDMLNQFLFYFKDKAAKLINQAYKERFIIPTVMRGDIVKPPSYMEFLNLIKTKKVRMNFCKKEVVFSHREYECLIHLARGKTMKETGKILELSDRTVEDHLTNAKNKTNCFTRAQLIDSFLDNLLLF